MGHPSVVPMKGEIIITLQFSKGNKRKESTFLANLKLLEGAKKVQAAKTVQEVLKEFNGLMPIELPKRLPLRREVGYAIELEPGAKPPTFAPYRIEPPVLKKPRIQLKELLEISYIHPSKSPYDVTLVFQKKYDGLP